MVEKKGRTDIKTWCGAEVCIEPTTQKIQVDLTKTSCPPELAKNFLQGLMSGKDVEWKLPKVVKPKE